MKRLLRTAIVTAAVVLSFATVASAGGPVISFTGVPPEFDAGTPYNLDFTVTSHGIEPLDLAETQVRFQGPNGEVLTFPGEPMGLGRWTVEVTLPDPGEWRMDVLSGREVLQSFGTMSVSAPAAAGLWTSLRIALPVATVLAVLALLAQALPRARARRETIPASDGV